MDLTIRAGAMARLECAALGHPAPQIAWQKDGGTDFPAARERRMHVMPEDDVFFIVDVKIEDIGVYARKCVGDEMYTHMMEIAAMQKQKAAEERHRKKEEIL